MMRHFRWYREVEPGLIVRQAPEEQVTAEGMAHLDRAMVAHFGRLIARPELAPLLARRYGRVVSIGGGHPNLEANLQAECIVVADPLHELYAAHAAAFRAAWPKAPPVEWVWCPMDGQPEVISRADLVVFSHVLEHMPLALAQEYVQWIPPTADLLIYGPNSDRMASDDWMHSRPVHQHVWLPGLVWMRAWAERLTGRTATIALAHDEDLLLWLPARSEASGGRGTCEAPRTPQNMPAAADTAASGVAAAVASPRPAVADPNTREEPSDRPSAGAADGAVADTSTPYGYCPHCGRPGRLRERRPGGDDVCASGHRYKSRTALPEPPTSGCGGTPLQTRSNQSGSPPEASA